MIGALQNLTLKGSHEKCAVGLKTYENRSYSLERRLHPHPSLPSRGGGLSAGQDGEVNRGRVLVRREHNAAHPLSCLALWERWHGAAVTERLSEAVYWLGVKEIRRTPFLASPFGRGGTAKP